MFYSTRLYLVITRNKIKEKMLNYSHRGSSNKTTHLKRNRVPLFSALAQAAATAIMLALVLQMECGFLTSLEAGWCSVTVWVSWASRQNEMQNTATWNRQATRCQIKLKNNINNGAFHQHPGFDAPCTNKSIPDQLHVNVKTTSGVVVEKQKTGKVFIFKKY